MKSTTDSQTLSGRAIGLIRLRDASGDASRSPVGRAVRIAIEELHPSALILDITLAAYEGGDGLLGGVAVARRNGPVAILSEGRDFESVKRALEVVGLLEAVGGRIFLSMAEVLEYIQAALAEGDCGAQ